MTPDAILFLVISLLLVWGGLVASTVFLITRSEVSEYPPGGDEPPSHELPG